MIKNLPANADDAGDLGSIPGSGRSPGGGNGNPPQYSCRENPMGKGAWWASVHGITKSRTRLSECTDTHTHRWKTDSRPELSTHSQGTREGVSVKHIH